VDFEANWGADLSRLQWSTTAANPPATLARYSVPDHPWLARYGLALEDTWSGLEWLHATAGYRVDSDTRYEPQQNFRAALVLQPTEDYSAKLLWGTAYRIPSIRESYIVEAGGAPDGGNPQLRPERIETAETQLAAHPWKWAEFDVAVYRNVVVGSIGPNPGVLIGTYQNLGNYTTYGVEPELTLRGPMGTELYANYTHQNSFDDYGDTPGGVVNEMMNAGAQVKFPYLGMRIDWHRSGVRARPTAYQYGVAASLQRDRLDGYDVANLVFTTNRLPVDLQVGLYNVFDATYYDPDPLEGKFDREWARRTLFGEVRTEF
jgi:iron complex outermembrane receptor protein